MHDLLGPAVAALLPIAPQAAPAPSRPPVEFSADLLAKARAIAAIAPADHPIPPRTVDVVHYALRIAVDLARHRVEGSAELQLHPFGGPRSTIELDADELTIAGVADGAGRPLQHHLQGTKLSIDLGREAPPEEGLVVRVDYSATPRRGLVFVDGPAAGCWSQGECQMNSAWFPCRDFPDDRATSELFVTVADGLTSVGNGLKVETLPADGGRHTDHWKCDFPHPAYLTSLAVGTFAEVDLGRVHDVPLFAYCAPARKDAVAAALQPTGRMVEVLEELAGAPYPWPVYRQVLVDGFPYGGMENLAATTLADDDVPALERLDEGRRDVDDLVVHELAHQWFGDLVSATSWADIWLAEGFATFAEPWWVERREGEDAAAAAWAARRKKAVEHASEEPRPIVCATYVEPDDVFDANVYERAGCFLELLRSVVGDEKFLAGLHAWIARERDRSVATADFEALFAEVAGPEAAPLLHEWLHAPGLPEIDFSWNFDAARRELELVAEQKQKGDGTPEVFHVPVDVAVVAGGARHPVRFALDARTSRTHVPCEQPPEFVEFNEGGALFGTLHVDQPAAAWRAQLASATDAAGRAAAASALGEAWAGMQGAAEREPTLAILARAVVVDRSPLVRVEAAAALAKVGGDSARYALAVALWDEAAEVRAAAAAALGKFTGDSAAVGVLLRRFQTDRRVDVRAACLEALAGIGVGEVAGALVTVLEDEKFPPELRGGALAGLASIEKLDEALLRRTVQSATALAGPAAPPALRKAAIAALGELAKRNDGAADALAALLDRPSLEVKAQALDALEEALSPRTLPALVRFHETAAFPDQRSHARHILVALLKVLPP